MSLKNRLGAGTKMGIGVLLSSTLAIAISSTAHAVGFILHSEDTEAEQKIIPRAADILFIQDGDTIEVHLSFDHPNPESPNRHTGDSEDRSLAWIIPVPEEPEIRLGSKALFQELSDASAPFFYQDLTYENCRDESLCAVDGVASFGSGFGEGEGEEGGPENGSSVPAGLGLRETFNFSADELDQLFEWTETQSLELENEQREALKAYAKNDFSFIAIQLEAPDQLESIASQIHPIVLRYKGEQLKAPLLLSASGGEQSLFARFYFLGHQRFVPTNNFHLVLNPLTFDWYGPHQEADEFDEGYLDALSEGVQETEGYAFATEYAGPSKIVDRAALVDKKWDQKAFESIDVTEVIDELESQNLIDCGSEPQENSYGDDSCIYLHPRIDSLLRRFLPVPAKLSSYEYYSDLEEHRDSIDQESWDNEQFNLALQEEIFSPAKRAQELLQSLPYLTRLHTFVGNESSQTIDDDPRFHGRQDLNDVSNEWISVWHDARNCGVDETPSWLEFEDGRTVAANQQDRIPDLELSHALRIESIPINGNIKIIEDHEAKSESARKAWNENNRSVHKHADAKAVV